MKRALTILAVAGLLGLFASAAMAADATDTQTVTCTVNGLADAIVAPVDVTLTCDRLGSAATTTAGTCTYGSETGSRSVTVAAAGTGVEGAKLNIKGGDLTTYTLLITGSTSETAVTLKSGLAAADPGTTVADNIYLELDAGGVAAGATGLGTAWTYTLTYTLVTP